MSNGKNETRTSINNNMNITWFANVERYELHPSAIVDLGINYGDLPKWVKLECESHTAGKSEQFADLAVA